MNQADTPCPIEKEGNSSVLLPTGTPLGEEKKNQSSFSLTTPKGTKIEVQRLEEVVSHAPEEREWVVEGILPDSGLAVLGGRHKRGKSTLAIHLCRSVALGEPFLGRVTK